LNGGYLQGRTVILSGGPGTGKSVLAWHFLFEGLKHKEAGILLSLDQSAAMIRSDMGDFGWNPEQAMKQGALIMLCGTLNLVPVEDGYEYTISFEDAGLREKPFTVPRLAGLLKQKAVETHASRVVVDGLGPILELAGSRFEIRQLVYGFIREVSSQDVTVIMTHELRSNSTGGDEMPHFIADGVIRLDMVQSAGDFIRTMQVVKMRGTSHTMKPVMFKIGNEGIVVFPDTRLHEEGY